MSDLHPLFVAGLMIAVAVIMAVPLYLDRHRPPLRRKVRGSLPVIPDMTGGPLVSQSRVVRRANTTRVDLHLQCARDYAVMAADAYRRGDTTTGDRYHDMTLTHLDNARKETT